MTLFLDVSGNAAALLMTMSFDECLFKILVVLPRVHVRLNDVLILQTFITYTRNVTVYPCKRISPNSKL